jgi:hypothetical protein
VATPNYQLDELLPTTAERETYNRLINFIDGVFSNVALADINVTDFPASPAAGRVVLVGTPATGAATGLDGHIAFYTGTEWRTVAPDAQLGPQATAAGFYKLAATLDQWEPLTGGGAGGDVNATPTDTAPGPLDDKILPVGRLGFTLNNPGGDESLTLAITPGTIYDNDISITRQTLAADLVLAGTDDIVQVIDPGGAPRNVDVPDGQQGASFDIIVIGDTPQQITVRESVADGNATIQVLADQSGSEYRLRGYHDGTDWLVLATIRA